MDSFSGIIEDAKEYIMYFKGCKIMEVFFMSEKKLNQRKTDYTIIVFICTGLGAFLGLVAYVRDWF